VRLRIEQALYVVVAFLVGILAVEIARLVW
jgi:hypothetical protein